MEKKDPKESDKGVRREALKRRKSEEMVCHKSTVNRNISRVRAVVIIISPSVHDILVGQGDEMTGQSYVKA